MVVSWNEDVEIGRCVSKMLQLQCTWAWEVRRARCHMGGYYIITIIYGYYKNVTNF